MLTPAEQARICAAARAYKGVPWRGQGRDRLGVDCAGLPVVVYRDAGFEIDEGNPDYRGVDTKRLLQILMKYCERLPRDAHPMPGDIVVYGIPHEAHVAMIVDGIPLNAIHSPLGRKVVEVRFDPTRGNIRRIYRWANQHHSSR